MGTPTPSTDLRVVLSGSILAVIVLCALFADVLAPYDPLAIDAVNALQGPSASHPFGTDEIGRDILSRVIYGARVSLSVAAAAVLMAMAIGVPIGIAAAYAGGWVDNTLMRAIDVFVSVPEIFVAIVIMAFLESNLTTLVFTIGLLYFPQFARVSYSVCSNVQTREFVLAARTLGAGPLRIVAREIVPSMVPVIVVQASFTLSFAMLLEAGLSFLGLGIMPPTASWGQMIGTLKDYLFQNPWPVVFPSAALFAAIFAVNVLGDWLQDRLNPEISR